MNIAGLKNLHWKNIDFKNIFRNKKIWIPIAVLLLSIIGVFVAFRTLFNTRTEANTTPAVQTAVARLGDLTIFTSGAGKVIPVAEISIGFQESGVLSEILVRVGEEVQAGQVLARLQTGNSEESIAASIASAELAVLSAQKNLDEIYSSAEMAAAEALRAMEEAQKALDDIKQAAAEESAQSQLDLASAQQALEEAQSRRIAMNYPHSTNPLVIEKAEIDYRLAKDTYKEALKAFNKVANKKLTNPDRVRALKALLDAEQKMDEAFATYNWYLLGASQTEIAQADGELAVAQANLAQAQDKWERVKDGPTEGEIALAEAQLVFAQAEWERLKDGPDSRDIAIAEASLANAKAQLALAKQKKAIEELVAPTNGTIISISASVGESPSSGAFIVLADLSQPLVEVYLDEADMNKMAVGYEAEVIFDALPDITFTGHVVQVDPGLATVSNVSMVRALVKLDGDSFAKPQTLPIGLNGSVDVIGGRAENAVLVPIEALRELSPGEYAVFIMENGEPKLRTVSVGLIDLTSAQILNGLEAGEIVTTGVVQTNQGN